jgi:hypothetical protein
MSVSANYCLKVAVDWPNVQGVVQFSREKAVAGEGRERWAEDELSTIWLEVAV